MTFLTLKTSVGEALFFGYQVRRLFPGETPDSINVQLSRWANAGKLLRLKRDVFLFPDGTIDEFVVAGLLRSPSYVSLESALSAQGTIPDVAVHTTSVTTRAPKTIRTPRGVFIYRHLKPELFFGFVKRQDPASGRYYDIAEPEKALLDLIYIRNIRSLASERIVRNMLNEKTLRRYGQNFPRWVQEAVV